MKTKGTRLSAFYIFVNEKAAPLHHPPPQNKKDTLTSVFFGGI